MTGRQEKMLRALSGTFEPARDIAGRAEVDSRAAGSVLASLEQAGLAERKLVREGGGGRDPVYEWRKTS